MAPGYNPDEAAQELVRLGARQFPQLTRAESFLLLHAPRGLPAPGGLSADPKDPTNDPSKADKWDPDREVRAELIRWLCGDSSVSSRVDPKGIQLFGAKVTGPLDLSSCTLRFPLFMFWCCVTEEINVSSASLPGLYLNGSSVQSISADGLRVEGNVHLREGFTAHGQVRLPGAQIGGNLDCTGGMFKNPPQKDSPGSGTALIADGMNVTGSVFLRNKFIAEGEVRLPGAHIGGQLDCTDGTFKNAPQKDIPDSGRALSADGLEVGGEVHLGRSFRSEGEVRLGGAHIGGQLMCDGGTFINPPHDDLIESGNALTAAGVEVRGSIFLGNGFRAEGTVNLRDARVQGAVSCAGATIEAPQIGGLPLSGKAFVADRAVLTGGIYFGKGFVARGEVSLMVAETGDVDFEGAKFTHLIAQKALLGGRLLLCGVVDSAAMTIDLKDTLTDVLLDDQESWPGAGNLNIDGFVYGRIARGPTDAEARLQWLALQAEFTPQPYRQLSKVLRESGDDQGARRVLYGMEKLRQRQQFRITRVRLRNGTLSQRSRLIGWTRYALAHAWGWVLKATIGYGFRLERALYCILVLAILGAVIFHRGYRVAR